MFLKHPIDEAEASEQADAPWLSKAVSHWRVQAAITEVDLVGSPLKKSGQAVKRAEADLHKVGRSSLQEARKRENRYQRRKLSAGRWRTNCAFSLVRKGNSHSASDRTGESGMVGVIECC